MATDLGWSQPKISRTERGETLPPHDDISRWLDYCHASEQQRRDILNLANRLTNRVTTTRDLNRGNPAQRQHTRMLREAQASQVITYQTTCVPALLQTPEYTRHFYLSQGCPPGDHLAELVAAQLGRQKVLYEGARQIHALITETALTWRPGPASVSRDQINRLSTLALPNVRIGVIPAARQHRLPPCTSFDLTRWPDGTADVIAETLTSALLVTDADGVRAYLELLTRVEQLAVYGEKASRLLRQLARPPR